MRAKWRAADRERRGVLRRMEGPTTSRRPLSVVIVTWNSSEHIGRCLRSLEAARASGEIECIVVDNDSADDTVEVVAAHPWVRLHRHDRNGGFAVGCNIGARMATTDLVMLLNPDTAVEPDALDVLVAHLEADPEVGMCGPLLVSENGRPQRPSARLGPNLRFDLLHEGLRLGRRVPWVRATLARRWQYPYDLAMTQRVEAISGAAMLMRREALDEVGLLDEAYRHCAEDFDLCVRFRRAGWEIEFVADAVVLHSLGASSRRAPNRTTVEALTGRVRYYRKNRSLAHALAFRGILVGVRVPVTLVRGITEYARDRDREALRARRRLAWCLVTLRPYPER